MIDVLMYEDNKLLRESIQLFFESLDNINFLGSFNDCRNIDKQIKKHLPDVILMDIDMPYVNGISGVRQCKEYYPSVKIIMFTVFEDEQRIFDSICAGADGYILKKTSPEKILESIIDVHNGGSAMSPGIAKLLIARFKENNIQKIEYNLSQREIEILSYLVKGYAYKQIADTCNISIDTVKRHFQNIYHKLQVNCGTEAVAKAIREKII